MTSTPDALLGIEIQAQNDNTGAWWENANQALTELAAGIAKETAISTTGGDTALTVVPYAADQSRCPIIRIAAGQTLLSLVRVTTARARLYYVSNESAAGAFAVQFGGNTSNLVTITRGCGAWVRVRSDSTTTFAGPLVNLTTGAIDGASLASGAFLLGANNLSDLANASTARTNLGVAIGSNVQAYAANLASWAGIAPAAKQDASANLAAWSALATAAKLTTASDLADLHDAPIARTNLGVPYASQANMEAAASGVVVTPSVQHHHLAHPKAHGRNSGGALLAGSYGITSIAKTATGTYTVTLSAALVATGTPIASPSQTNRVAWAVFASTTTITVHTLNPNDGTAADSDFAIVVFGDA